MGTILDYFSLQKGEFFLTGYALVDNGYLPRILNY